VAYPAAHRGGISFEHKFGRFRLGIHPAARVDRPRGVKSQYRAARHADAVVRHHAQHQRAGRQARPVDHDAFARGAYTLEQIEKRADLSARTGEDPNLGLRRRQGERAQHRREENRFQDSRSHQVRSYVLNDGMN
jgi:hypothetical protein